jgi:hypothetical protein
MKIRNKIFYPEFHRALNLQYPNETLTEKGLYYKKAANSTVHFSRFTGNLFIIIIIIIIIIIKLKLYLCLIE